MEGLSLKSRGTAFALCAGAVVFILALLAMVHGNDDEIVAALVVALVCGTLSWRSAERAISGIAEAIDHMAERLVAAADGDLVSPMPAPVSAALPDLARAMEGLFGQVRVNLDSVHMLALFDPVTSLPNRLNFRREAERALGDIAGTGGAALLFIDLDRFKMVNDSLGHAEGDKLLMMVANRLRHVLSEDEAGDAIVARLAGDEFTLFAPAVDEAEATRLARRALFALAEPFDLAGHRLNLGASIGLALFPEHGSDLTTMMRAADIAMYHAKAEGRGQFQVYSAALAERYESRLKIDRELRHALEAGGFALHFQPQRATRGDDLAAVEALLRWHHPDGDLRTPRSFVPAAEESGLIVAIGDWVIEEAAERGGRWVAAGRPLRMSVNVSPRQLDRPDFFAGVLATLARHAVPPALLELEITESIAMQCSPAVIEGIAGARALGISIAIDDFGTGYSNLSRLKALRVDRVKLDPSLIRDVTDSADARTLVHSVVGLIHALGYEVVAEGVEGRDQAEVLSAIGCDLLQGFLVAAPMPEPALLAWRRQLHPDRVALAG